MAPIPVNLLGAKAVFITFTRCQEITGGFCCISLPGFSVYKVSTYLFQALSGSKIHSILCQICQNQTGNSLWAQKLKQYCSVGDEHLGQKGKLKSKSFLFLFFPVNRLDKISIHSRPKNLSEFRFYVCLISEGRAPFNTLWEHLIISQTK